MPIPVLMPALSPTMEEGTLAKWLKKEGDSVTAGDVIAEIETDKATMEVEAVDEGTLGKILVGEGTEGVAINKPIAVILEDGEDESDLEGFDASGGSAAPKKEAAAEKAPEPEKKEPAANGSASSALPKSGDAPATPVKNGTRIFASPLARRMAEQKGIDLAALEGSGPHGRIVKRDVEAAKPGKAAPAEKKAGKPAGEGAAPARIGALPDPRVFFKEDDYEEVPLDGMRKSIAKRLTQSMQEIPHYYLTVDCELDELMRVRKELNARAEGDGVKISVNDFVVRAAALALKKVPEVNVSFAGDALLMHKHADVGIAVAIDGGLITPIIREAENKGLAEIANEAKDLAARAKDKKLKPAEFEGGSFAVSNLGMFGIRNFTAVINPPHAGILAVGKGEQRPVVKDGALTVATMMTVTMSCDHRAVDGALGARFLDAFKRLIEDPLTMLL